MQLKIQIFPPTYKLLMAYIKLLFHSNAPAIQVPKLISIERLPQNSSAILFLLSFVLLLEFLDLSFFSSPPGLALPAVVASAPCQQTASWFGHRQLVSASQGHPHQHEDLCLPFSAVSCALQSRSDNERRHIQGL